MDHVEPALECQIVNANPVDTGMNSTADSVSASPTVAVSSREQNRPVAWLPGWSDVPEAGRNALAVSLASLISAAGFALATRKIRIKVRNGRVKVEVG